MGRWDSSEFGRKKKRRDFLIIGAVAGAGLLGLAALGLASKNVPGPNNKNLTVPHIPYTSPTGFKDTPMTYNGTDILTPTSLIIGSTAIQLQDAGLVPDDSSHSGTPDVGTNLPDALRVRSTASLTGAVLELMPNGTLVAIHDLSASEIRLHRTDVKTTPSVWSYMQIKSVIAGPGDNPLTNGPEFEFDFHFSGSGLGVPIPFHWNYQDTRIWSHETDSSIRWNVQNLTNTGATFGIFGTVGKTADASPEIEFRVVNPINSARHGNIRFGSDTTQSADLFTNIDNAGGITLRASQANTRTRFRVQPNGDTGVGNTNANIDVFENDFSPSSNSFRGIRITALSGTEYGINGINSILAALPLTIRNNGLLHLQFETTANITSTSNIRPVSDSTLNLGDDTDSGASNLRWNRISVRNISSGFNTLAFRAGNGGNPASFNVSAINPNADNTSDLGTAALRWKSLYLTGASLHMLGAASDANDTTTLKSGELDFGPGGATVVDEYIKRISATNLEMGINTGQFMNFSTATIATAVRPYVRVNTGNGNIIINAGNPSGTAGSVFISFDQGKGLIVGPPASNRPQGVGSIYADTAIGIGVNDSGVAGQLAMLSVINKYNNITTAGFGVPAIVAEGDLTGQTGTVASVAAYTVGAANGVFKVGGDIDITAFTSGTVLLQVTYTDWNSGAQTITIDSATLLADTLGTEFTLMAKASTSITIKTTGTFTATYNVAATITQYK